MRSMRESTAGENGDVGGGVDEGEGFECGTAAPTGRERMAAQARLRRQRIRAGVLGTRRGSGVQGSAGMEPGGEGGDGGNAMPTVRGRGRGRGRARGRGSIQGSAGVEQGEGSGVEGMRSRR